MVKTELYLSVGGQWANKDLYDMKKSEEGTQTYLYNGVELPALPEWDKTTYPYAVISKTGDIWGDNRDYELRCTDKEPTARFDDEATTDFNIRIMYPEKPCRVMYFDINYDTEWNKYFEQTLTVSEPVNTVKVSWANFDLKYEDGTLCLAASEPVPMGGTLWNKKQIKEAYKRIGGEWVKIAPTPTHKPYLTFSSAEPFTIGVVDTRYKTWDGTLYYSTDMETWNEWDHTASIASAENGGEQRIYMRGNGNSVISYGSLGAWSLAGSNIRCDGNIENLLDYELVANGEHPVMGSSCFSCMFANCTSLISPPELPAAVLSPYCYSEMFKGCTNLKTVPALPAMTLADYCYYMMFQGCTSLITAPSLSATILSDSCYRRMFEECSGLTTAPELPATTLIEYCYYSMFEGCTGLIEAPELSATNLADGCYERMFTGCSKLTIAPELPATTLAEYCYSYMFAGCISLTTTPKLPATVLAKRCYLGMFRNCTGLIEAAELPAIILADHCYAEMFYGCSGLSTAPELPVTTLEIGCYSQMFAKCTNLTTSPTLPATTLEKGCYQEMFSECTGLTEAPELPATTLAEYCYSYMFAGCTGLTEAPELPATTLAEYCYLDMFARCTELIATPALPATNLAEYCYSYMFKECTKLTTTPELPATTLLTSCYRRMFYGCSNVKLSSTKVGEYQTQYRIPTSGNGSAADGALSNMFQNTGGTFTGTPTINTTYYTSNVVVPSVV